MSWKGKVCRKVELVSTPAMEAGLCMAGKPPLLREGGAWRQSIGHKGTGHLAGKESFFFMKESGLYFPEGRVAPPVEGFYANK